MGMFWAPPCGRWHLVIVAIPVLGLLYIVVRLLRQLVTGLWKKTRGKALQRTAAMTLVWRLLAGLAWAWWPDGGTYRPVQAYERGTLGDATRAILPARVAEELRQGGTGQTVALWPAGATKPTRDNPQLSMVLVPVGEPAAGAAGGTDAAVAPAAPSWVFPFDRPAAPEADGNQALAVNTTDGSVAYSVAFALVWAEDGAPVTTANEAYAFANCSGCAAVAVGFQVVLVVGQTDVIVPENLSAAANYNCLDCLTYALASQLVLTLDGPLDGDSKQQLEALWAQIAEYGRNIRDVPLSEIQASSAVRPSRRSSRAIPSASPVLLTGRTLQRPELHPEPARPRRPGPPPRRPPPRFPVRPLPPRPPPPPRPRLPGRPPAPAATPAASTAAPAPQPSESAGTATAPAPATGSADPTATPPAP